MVQSTTATAAIDLLPSQAQPYPSQYAPGDSAPVLSLDVSRAAANMFQKSIRLCDADFPLRIPFVVDGWLSQGEVSIVYAPSNAGKTSWVLDITRAITTDQDWHGYRTAKGGSVLYIAAEAPGSIYRRTVRFPDAAKERFIVFGEPVDLVGDRSAGEKVAALADLCEINYDLCISLVVLDTLTLCFGDGDENTTRDAGRAIASAKRIAELTGAHVMLVHHTGKDRNAGARGSYSITGNSDAVIELVPIDEQEKSVMAIQRKQREGTKDAAIVFKIVSVVLGEDEDGEPITTSGIEVMDSRADANRPSASRPDRGMEAVLYALRALETENPATQGFTASEIAKACAETFKPGSAVESRKKAVRGVLRQAAERQTPLVSKDGERFRTISAPTKA